MDYIYTFASFRDEVIDYLIAQDEEYFAERGTTKAYVLANDELIRDIAEEHYRCVERYGVDRAWSLRDACDNDPGITRN